MTINQPNHTNNEQNEPSTSIHKSEPLTAQQLRVLACLMEKQLTTPNNYPLTINALMNACNQKSNREPIMQLSEGEVGQIVHQLETKDLARLEYGDRANKVFHKARGYFQLDIDQQALLTVMMLRKPQTLNELKTRTARMTDFADNAAIKTCLQTLINRDTPLVTWLAKGQGQREERYTQTLHENNETNEPSLQPTQVTSIDSSTNEATDELQRLQQRITALEKRVAELEHCLN
ncbi:MAG: YceH family protein [bacterium]